MMEMRQSNESPFVMVSRTAEEFLEEEALWEWNEAPGSAPGNVKVDLCLKPESR